MAKQTINIGTSANDGTGDTLRGGFTKVNDNFTELYNAPLGFHNLLGYTNGTALSFGLGLNATLSSLVSLAVNSLTLFPFIPSKSITSSSLNINVTTLGIGSFARILIYSDLNGLPNTKLYESSNLDFSTTGIKTATTTFTFTAGNTYWFALNISGSGATVSAIPVAACISIFNIASTPYTCHRNTSVVVGSAPDTYTYSSYTNSAVPNIYITP
jgi:hypothetical protein